VTIKQITQHTPGPWAVKDDGDWQLIVQARNVLAPEHACANTIADARLIAAAPDLLAAARLTVLHFSRNRNSGTFQGDDEHEAWSALTAAIAKAEAQ